MAHDIFISYSSKDKQTADAICHVLEADKLKCWIAPRNIIAGKNYAEQIMYGLKNAKIVVLVFSKNSQDSVFVNNEIDTAFSNNKPIISFKIDETLPENKMGFFLKNKHWLDAYPNPESVFETLVRDAHLLCNEEDEMDYVEPAALNYYTFNINEKRSLEDKINNNYSDSVNIVELDEDVDDVVDGSDLGVVDDVVDGSDLVLDEETVGGDNASAESVDNNEINADDNGQNSSNGLSGYKIPIIVGVLILIAIVGVVVFTGLGNTSIGGDSADFNVEIDYIQLDDDRKEGYSTDYSYIVFGSISNQENALSDYVIHIDFYDDSGNVVKINDTKLKDAKDNILGAAFVDKNNIARVEVELRDNNGNVISAAESNDIIK